MEPGQCGKRTMYETLFFKHVMHPTLVNSILLYKFEGFVPIEGVPSPHRLKTSTE